MIHSTEYLVMKANELEGLNAEFELSVVTSSIDEKR